MLESLGIELSRGTVDRTPNALNRLLEEHRDLLRRYRMMKKGLGRAARIQQSLLPARSPSIAGYEFTHFYRPCEEVGGDFYDFVECNEGLVLIVSDVIGHGFEAALTTMLMKELFEEIVATTAEPVEILTQMNVRLHRALPEGMFAAAAVLKLEVSPQLVRFANAGLPYPFVLRASDGLVEEVQLAGFPLGLFGQSAPLTFDAQTLSLLPGDVLLVGSDGIHAIAGNEGDAFDPSRIPAILAQLTGKSGREVIDAILAEVSFDASEPLADDVNLLAITCVKNEP